MRDFKRLLIWQKGMDIVKEIYQVAVYFPSEEKFGMRSQVVRSAVSIPSNIAEGSAKKSEKDYKRFIEIALGSSFELETHMMIIDELNWFPNETASGILSKIREEQKMLSAFLNKL